MEHFENFKQLDKKQLWAINGGGFAYDVGRILRYLALGGGIAAYTDWVVNDIVNDVVNEVNNE